MLALIGFVGLCLLVQFVGGTAAANGLTRWYPSLRSPPFTPPAWVFGQVWTVLNSLTGVAAWLIWRRFDPWRPSARPALRLWGWQIALIALWPAIFFGLRAPGGAMLIMLGLVAVSIATFVAFFRRSVSASVLLLPSLVWLCYAAYLNAGFWWLNQGFGASG